jgi:hypothetical protein
MGEAPTKIRQVYWLLCIPGFLSPYAFFAPWLAEHGLDVPRFMEELFSTRVGACFGCDVIISAKVLIVFASQEIRRLSISFGGLPMRRHSVSRAHLKAALHVAASLSPYYWYSERLR